MRRCFSLLAVSLVMVSLPCSSVFSQDPPPPGGGSTGGNYGDPGGGDPGGGDPGGGGGGSNTGSGNPNDLVGGTALRDNAAGGDAAACCGYLGQEGKLEVNGTGKVPDVWCATAPCPIGPNDEAPDCGGDTCCPGTGCSGSDGSNIAKHSWGCGSCGGGQPVNAATGGGGGCQLTDHKASRQWLPWNRPTHSSFGPGVFSGYDSKVYFYPDSISGTTAVFFDAKDGRSFNLVDGLDGDTEDGVFHDLRNGAYKSLELKDVNGTVVTSLGSADHAVVTSWTGVLQKFDVFDLSSDPMVNEYVARMESLTDRRGNTLAITYRDSLAAGSGGFTAQELTDSPDRRWQIYQVTDRQGDISTYSYKSTQESGRWVVEKIDLPNTQDIDYAYTDGHLSSVTHPSGDVSSYTYGQDSLAQTATVEIKQAGAGPARTMHLTNDYMTLNANGQSQVINQPQGVFRMAESNAGETLAMLVPDQNQAAVYDLYHGTGSSSQVVLGVSNQYYSDGWEPTLQQSVTITLNGVGETTYSENDPATTIEDFYQGTIPGQTDETGREFTYDYDTDGFLTKKTFVADSTYEEYAYNSFKQTTRVRDRQGNVTLYEYDATGNMTKQKTGLMEVGGSDVAQPEYAELQWEYYPVGHANAGLLKTAFDAEWDGSSTDLHRTDYEYNARGLMTKKLESASVSGGDRPETNWTYDANDRVATTTDPGGHQSDDTYNDRGQLIEKEYDDASTEQTLYGAIGTPEEGLVIKTKNRRNVVTSYAYDSAGRTTQVTVGTAWDADILDGNADDTPITDRNEQSITTYAYLDGTELPIEVVRDGSKTEYVYDYRQRVIETKVYPYANKIMSSKVVYVDNKKFSDEDYYGRKKYYGYRASDGQLIRYVTGAYPSFSLADQAAVFNLVRDTNLNPAYTIKDAITDENGRPKTVIDERGTQFLTEYNAAGQVIRETKAVGTPVEAITEMDYDEDGNVIEIRSPRYFDSTDTNGYQKCKTVMTYDGHGRVLTRTEAPGTPEAATESYAYDSEGRQVTRTDARGKIWTTNYASCCGHSVSSKNPLGHGSITNKDNGGLVTHTAGIGDVDTHTSLLDPIDSKTLRETTTRYDALGRSTAACTWLVPQGIIDPENPPMAGLGGVSGQDGLTSQTLYDADLTDGIGLDSTAGVTVTNPLGGTFTVSLLAALTKMAEPIAQGGANTTFDADATGSAVVHLNAENEVSFIISDAEGRTIIRGIQSPHDPLPGNTQGDLLTWGCRIYDTTEQLGNGETVLASINVDALAHTTKSRSNALGHTLETIDQLGFASTVKYDASGNAAETRDVNQTGYDMVYDDLNRNTSRTDMVGSQTQSVFDKVGQEITQVDAKGKSTSHQFDARGNRIQTTNRIGGVVQFTYDPAGNQLSVTDAEQQTTAYEYDDRSLKIRTIYPDHQSGSAIGTTGYGIMECTYDALNRRHVCTDQVGDTKTFNYDLASRLLSRDYRTAANSPTGTIADTDSFTYDRLSRLLTANSGRYSNICGMTYNDAGKKISEALTIGGQTYTTTSTYDIANRKTQITYPDGTMLTRAYTHRNQLETVTYDGNTVDTRSYDNGGRLTSSLLGNGITDTRTYNLDNTLVSISSSNADVGTYSYTWDANKNKTTETITGPLSAYSFTTGLSGYDDEDRLIYFDRGTGSSSPLNQQWNLTLEGNWDLFTQNGVVQNRTHGPTHEVNTVDAATVTYDAKGNLTNKLSSLNPAEASVMTWDFDNQLVSVDTDSDGTTDAEYSYDATGRRVAKNNSVLFCSHQQVLAEYSLGSSSASPLEKYVFGSFIDEPIVKDGSGGKVFYHRNEQYSIIGLTDVSGAAVEYFAYDSNGSGLILDTNLSVSVGSAVSNQYTYTGRRLDAEVGFYFFRARYFDSKIGRFLSRDPLGYVDGMNLAAAYFSTSDLDPMGTRKFKCSCSCMMAVPYMSAKPKMTTEIIEYEGTFEDVRRKCREDCDKKGSASPYGLSCTGHLSSNIFICNRDINKAGLTCGARCGAGVLNTVSGHSFLAYFVNGEYVTGRGLTGIESEGALPTPEAGGTGGGWGELDPSNDCARCGLASGVKLPYGSGKDKTAETVSDDDIMDCIKNYPASHDYNMATYNCHHWRSEAAKACGVRCPDSLFSYPIYGTGPTPAVAR